MSNCVCIRVPVYLGESRPDRREVDKLRQSGNQAAYTSAEINPIKSQRPTCAPP